MSRHVNYDIAPVLKKPEDLASRLADQGEVVRAAKAKSSEWQSNDDVLDQIWSLIALKNFDPVLGNVPAEHRGPKSIKLRWRLQVNGAPRLFRNPAGNLVTLRYQHVFQNRFYLTGSEIKKAIEEYMGKPKIQAAVGDIGGLLKVELVVKGGPKRNIVEEGEKVEEVKDEKKPIKKEGKKAKKASEDKIKPTYVAVGETSYVRVPLEFPGPWMAKDTTINLRVTYAGPNHPPTTPAFVLEKHSIPELFDAGVNLTDEKFMKTYPAPIDRSFGAGVSQMMTLAIDIASSIQAIDLAKKFPNSICSSVGVHPVKAVASEFSEGALLDLVKLVEKNPDAVKAVGEIGLDYKHIREGADGEKDKIAQKQWFVEQLKAAAFFPALPIIVHEREAHSDCLDLLREHLRANPNAALVINCFTGNGGRLADYLALSKNVFITITGFLSSDDRSADLRSCVKDIPLDRLLLGSDAPHLIPFNMPRPFPRRNEPAFLGHALAMLSELLQKDPYELAKITRENSLRVFSMPSLLFNGQAPAQRPFNNDYFQKLEDENADEAKKQANQSVANLTRIDLTEEQDVYELLLAPPKEKKEEAVAEKKEEKETQSLHVIVTAAESKVLEKHQGRKTREEMRDLLKALEIKEVPVNSIVFKKSGEEVYRSAHFKSPQKPKKKAAEKKEGGGGNRGGRGGGRGRGGRGGRGRGGGRGGRGGRGARRGGQ